MSDDVFELSTLSKAELLCLVLVCGLHATLEDILYARYEAQRKRTLSLSKKTKEAWGKYDIHYARRIKANRPAGKKDDDLFTAACKAQETNIRACKLCDEKWNKYHDYATKRREASNA